MDARRVAAESLKADVLIVGGGPAGSAAAIACATNGLKTVVCEREVFPRERAGEALHPGVESLLRQLGVADRLEAVTGARFEGVEIDWAGQQRFEAFGADADGPWRGFQARRADFDAMLLDRAGEAGAEVLQPRAALHPLVEDGHVVGVETDAGEIACRLLIDASGPGRWLQRRLKLPMVERSPPMVVRYGYVTGACPPRDAAPFLTGDATGWTWIARVAEGRYQWVRLDLNAADAATPREAPDALKGLTPDGRSRGAEMGWRLTRAAGPGWMLAGDAAAMLDPTSSHGVLKALMSGFMAGQTAKAMLDGGDVEAGARAYRGWVEGWFNTDVQALRAMYARLGAAWAV